MRSDGARRVARDLVLIAFLGLLVELVLRSSAPEYGHKIFDNELTGSYPIERNRDFYRGPTLTLHKPPGQCRILALGDSVTFGTGVPASQAWPARLKQQLRARGTRAESINAGIEGSSLADLLLAWQEHWNRYEPDVVVLGATANIVSLGAIHRAPQKPAAKLRNDFDPPSRSRRLKIAANRWLHQLYLPSFANIQAQRALYWWGRVNHNVEPSYPAGPMLAFGWQQGDLQPDVAGRAWRAFAVDLAALEAAVRTTGAQLVVLWLPPRFLLSDGWRDNEKNVPRERFSIDPARRIESATQELHLPFVDVLGYLSRARESARRAGLTTDLYIHFDYNHFDGAGHAAAAQAAMDAVRCNAN